LRANATICVALALAISYEVPPPRWRLWVKSRSRCRSAPHPLCPRDPAHSTRPDRPRGCKNHSAQGTPRGRQEPDLLKRLKIDLPCPAPFQKIFWFPSEANHLLIPCHPVPREGRWPSSPTLGRGALDAVVSCAIFARTSDAVRGRRSRVVLTPRGRRQVCGVIRERRCQQSLVTGESTK
jgi:hypothetical protein